MAFKSLLLLVSLLSLCSCALVDSRDYELEMDELRADDPMFIAGEDFELASGDTGMNHRSYDTIINRTPPTKRMTADRRYNKSLSIELSQLEEGLGEGEFNKYARVSNVLGSDSERIYFLNLTNEEKSSYLELKGVKKPQNRAVASYSQTKGELKMGMSMDDVVDSLGQPSRVESSGNPSLQNERWHYNYGDRVNYVYFSGARVRGWE